jgi:hypothetical protein
VSGSMSSNFGQMMTGPRQSIVSMDQSISNQQSISESYQETVTDPIEIDHEEKEEACFKELKSQLLDMLTKNRKSKFNNLANLKGLNKLEIMRSGKGA